MVKSEESFKKLTQFFERFVLLHFKKGEAILRPYDTPSGIFYLKSGFVRLYSISKKGEEFTLIIFKPGDIFPLRWAINDSSTGYYFDAAAPVSTWRVSKKEFIAFIEENPDVLLEVTSRVLTRLGGILQRMEYLVYGNADQKIASIILLCAERFGKEVDGKTRIEVPLTHKDLANFVGISRETASIELKKFERSGLIESKNKMIIVKNRELLEKEALLP